MLSDFWYRAPVDQMVKLLVQQKVPVYWYVMNTTVEAFKLPEWRKVPHDAEHFFLTGAPFMDTEFFPKRLRLDRNMWTDNDRNMSHYFMKTYTDFARYGNPTPQQVLGIHFDVAKDGELKYLNLNTTYNSSILLNFRQTESAFWTQVNQYLMSERRRTRKKNRTNIFAVAKIPPDFKRNQFWLCQTTPHIHISSISVFVLLSLSPSHSICQR